MLNKKTVDEIFEKAEHQSDALIGIYKEVFPEWENIETVIGHPDIGEAGWVYICKKFIDFDRERHPKVFAGGLWLDNGFSCDRDLKDWVVKLCPVVYKQEYQGA